MTSMIDIQNVSKKYLLCHSASPYRTLVETLSQKARHFADRLRFSKSRCKEEEKEEFWALQNVSLQIHPGDRLGIVGRNGAGKSTLLKILARITPPTEGSIRMRGRVASLLEVGTGFHPELTGRENIFLNGAILGMEKREIVRKFDEIVAFAEIAQFLDTPVKRYSSGMYTRLGFAVAAHLDPDVLIVDEVLAVGDAQFQEKCLKTLNSLSKQEGRTIVFVSHDIGSVLTLCNRAIWLDRGQVKAFGHAEEVAHQYMRSCRVEGLEWEGEIGDEHIRFFRVSLKPTEGLREFYYQDESTYVEIDYEVLRPDPNFCLGIGVWNQRNQLLARGHTMDDLDQMHLFFQPGRRQAKLKIDAKLFHEGDYLLKLDCFIHNKKHIIRDEVTLKFAVYPRRKSSLFKTAPSIQGVSLGHPWQLSG